jgi:hypothetical protein
MFTPRDPASFMTTIVVIVTIGAIFWRAIMKLILIGFIGLAALGLLDLLQSLPKPFLTPEVFGTGLCSAGIRKRYRDRFINSCAGGVASTRLTVT